jgi:hypothetical protein
MSLAAAGRASNRIESGGARMRPASEERGSAELQRRFALHVINEEQAGRIQRIRCFGQDLAAAIEQATPPGRERANAITAVEEAVMWAIKAVATPPAPAARDLTMEAQRA